MALSSELTTVLEKKPKPKLKEPTLYKVLLHNDDYTPMDFVVQVLRTVFHKTPSEAKKIMLDVHEKGIGICGIYTHEIAETKTATVTKMARDMEYPLKCSIEPSS
jgi:ATP-dependent Clp protease adaptor protein ClpS